MNGASGLINLVRLTTGIRQQTPAEASAWPTGNGINRGADRMDTVQWIYVPFLRYVLFRAETHHQNNHGDRRKRDGQKGKHFTTKFNY